MKQEIFLGNGAIALGLMEAGPASIRPCASNAAYVCRCAKRGPS